MITAILCPFFRVLMTHGKSSVFSDFVVELRGPLPPGASWENVSMPALGDDLAWVSCDGETGIRLYVSTIAFLCFHWRSQADVFHRGPAGTSSEP